MTPGSARCGFALHWRRTTADLSPAKVYRGTRDLALVLKVALSAVRANPLALATTRTGWTTVRPLVARRLTTAFACWHGFAAGLREGCARRAHP